VPAVDDIAARASALASRTEEGRRLPDELIAAMRDARVLRLGTPSACGGVEASPAAALATARDVARADMSAGWCVAIANTSGLLGAYLPRDAAGSLLGGDTIAAGVWAPRARVVPDGDGLRVTGRWAFASGIDHAQVFFGGALLAGADDTARPEVRVVAVPVGELEVHDTWDVAGLRGTGSHDVSARDVFVPSAHVIDLARGPLDDAPLYRFPVFGLFALSLAAVSLGNALGAVDDLVDLAGAKTPLGSGRTLAARTTVQARVGAAVARLRAAQALVDAEVAVAWTAAQGDAAITTEHRLALRLAATHAVRTSAEVVRELHDLGGGSAIYAGSPLQRRLRDAETATAHAQVAPATWELCGRILLGLETDTAQL
jgi:alkylation response protein AidB-like acyl-CoA dehydrogenase